METNFVKISRYFIILLIAAGCFSNSRYMSYNTFEGIQLGTPIATVESEVGKPYSIHTNKDRAQEYEYIERLDREKYMQAENHYFLVVQDGAIVRKYMTTQWPPAYDLIYQDQPNYPGYPSSAVPP